MENKFEVIIIGAGPGGISAGITLLQNKIDCCIIDKCVFPRNKTCGGLMTQKTIEFIKTFGIDALKDGVIKNKVENVSIVNCGELITEFTCNSPFYLVDRAEFDNYLLQEFLALGGNFLFSKKAIKIEEAIHQVELDDGQKLFYNYIIGADGINGMTTKYVRRPPVARAFGLEVEILNRDISVDTAMISLDVGLFKDGYAWCFPKGEYVTIGFAFSYEKGFDYIDFFKKYLKRTYGFTKSVAFKGAFLPYGAGSQCATNEKANLLLVGDAAGFVDAITGEGIYYALVSGKYAAHAIAQERAGLTTSAIDYYGRSAMDIENSVKKSWRCISLFYKRRSLVLKLIKGHKNALAYFCEHQVAYDHFHYNLKQLGASYLKVKLFTKGGE